MLFETRKSLQDADCCVGKKTIYVYGGYEVRDKLRMRGYCYSKEISAWTKTVPENKAEEEKAWLHEIIGWPDYDVVDEGKLHSRNYFVVEGDCFGLRDEMKRRGYRARNESGHWVWQKPVDSGKIENPETRRLLLKEERESFFGYSGLRITIR